MALPLDHHRTGVHERRMVFCPWYETHEFSTDERIGICERCHLFFVHCCKDALACHHFRLVFVDGARLDDGRGGAVMGVGVVIGSDTLMWSEAFVGVGDATSTGQRAKLLGAIVGLERMLELERVRPDCDQISLYPHRHAGGFAEWIIATDSAYVVHGMLEWVPQWKRDNWCAHDIMKPANLDLFRALDGILRRLLRMNIKVGFWLIDRSFNVQADSLAKEAALRRQDLLLL